MDGQRVVVGNRRLMTAEGIDLGDLGAVETNSPPPGVRQCSSRSTAGPPGCSLSQTLPETPRQQRYASCTP